MQEPGVIRTRLWTERGLLPIHSEHNLPEGKLRRRDDNLRRPLRPALKADCPHGRVPLLFLPNCLKFPQNGTGHAAKSPAPESRSAIAHCRRGSSEVRTEYNNTHYCAGMHGPPTALASRKNARESLSQERKRARSALTVFFSLFRKQLRLFNETSGVNLAYI
jgi:hypothetical protein